MTTFGDMVRQFGGIPVGGVEALGMGHVYYVMQTTNANYAEFAAKHTRQYKDDGSSMLHNTIQSALDATKSERNDYVIVTPDAGKYNLTTALTMSKRNVHLICPAGLGRTCGATKAATIQQDTADTSIFTLTGRGCEIAGFIFINAPSTTGPSAIYSNEGYVATYDDAGAGSSHIHHNLFWMYLSAGANPPMIAGVTNSWAWSRIERNEFLIYAGGQTIATIINLGDSATGVKVDYNECTISDGATATIGFNVTAVKGSCSYNTLNESYGEGAGSQGNFGAAINIGIMTAAVGNRGAVYTDHFLSGGTDERTFCDNRDATAGGDVTVET